MRKILHMDLNAFYASVEQAENPELRGLPVAVGGDKEKRTGIILTASYEARKFGVKTGMTLGEAARLCPNIILRKPRFKVYMDYSLKVMDILKSFSPDVEQFSIDEAWIDVTGCEGLFGNEVEIAYKIKEKVKSELKITASVGVSYCKIMAKMASDFKKPDGVSQVMEKDVKRLIWPLPIQDLMGVGRKMRVKLNEIGIFTIGDLANSQLEVIQRKFGKMGRYLWRFANGIDNSRVSPYEEAAKGIGNSITVPRDVITISEASEVVMALCESVGRRVRQDGMEGNIIEITIKTNDFNSFTRQKKLHEHTDITEEIYKNAMKLLRNNWKEDIPIRLLGVRITGLRKYDSIRQISFFNYEKREKNEKLDRCMDSIREKYGNTSVLRAALLINQTDKNVRIMSKEEWKPMNNFNKGDNKV